MATDRVCVCRSAARHPAPAGAARAGSDDPQRRYNLRSSLKIAGLFLFDNNKGTAEGYLYYHSVRDDSFTALHMLRSREMGMLLPTFTVKAALFPWLLFCSKNITFFLRCLFGQQFYLWDFIRVINNGRWVGVRAVPQISKGGTNVVHYYKLCRLQLKFFSSSNSTLCRTNFNYYLHIHHAPFTLVPVLLTRDSTIPKWPYSFLRLHDLLEFRF